jgi:hypothetical protein
MWTLTNLLALFAFLLFAISQWDTDKRKRLKKIFAYSIAFCVLVVTFLKGCKDLSDATLYSNRQDSLKNAIDTVSKYQSAFNEKMKDLDTLKQFIKRVDSIGIKRDTGTNMPIVTKTINSNIKSQTNINSYNQKGGQTAKEITNNNP